MRTSQHPYWLGVAICLGIATAACGSSSSHATGTTTGATVAPKAATAPATRAAPATTAAQASATLVTPLCGILDSSTVVHIVGGDVGSCKPFADGALWGDIGAGKSSLQLTPFTGAELARRKLGWQLAFPKVAGAGKGAWSRGPFPIAGINNEVLYVDYGDFGLEFAVSSPTANNNTAVQLANAIK